MKRDTSREKRGATLWKRDSSHEKSGTTLLKRDASREKRDAALLKRDASLEKRGTPLLKRDASQTEWYRHSEKWYGYRKRRQFCRKAQERYGDSRVGCREKWYPHVAPS